MSLAILKSKKKIESAPAPMTVSEARAALEREKADQAIAAEVESEAYAAFRTARTEQASDGHDAAKKKTAYHAKRVAEAEEDLAEAERAAEEARREAQRRRLQELQAEKEARRAELVDASRREAMLLIEAGNARAEALEIDRAWYALDHESSTLEIELGLKSPPDYSNVSYHIHTRQPRPGDGLGALVRRAYDELSADEHPREEGSHAWPLVLAAEKV
jgi:hypothetical protein